LPGSNGLAYFRRNVRNEEKKYFLNRYPDFKVFADLIAEIVVVEVVAAADVIKLFTAVIYKC
jgi:hypothetical protein